MKTKFVSPWDDTRDGQLKRIAWILNFIRAVRSPRFSHTRKPYYSSILVVYHRNASSPTGVLEAGGLPNEWVEKVAVRFNLQNLRSQSPTFEDRKK